jgi:hypothetical protein
MPGTILLILLILPILVLRGRLRTRPRRGITAHGPGRSGRPLDIRIQLLDGLPTPAGLHSDAAVSTPQLRDEACPRSDLDRLPSDLDLAA